MTQHNVNETAVSCLLRAMEMKDNIIEEQSKLITEMATSVAVDEAYQLEAVELNKKIKAADESLGHIF